MTAWLRLLLLVATMMLFSSSLRAAALEDECGSIPQPDPILIEIDTIWNTSMTIDRDVVVSPYVTLTIQGPGPGGPDNHNDTAIHNPFAGWGDPSNNGTDDGTRITLDFFYDPDHCQVVGGYHIWLHERASLYISHAVLTSTFINITNETIFEQGSYPDVNGPTVFRYLPEVTDHTLIQVTYDNVVCHNMLSCGGHAPTIYDSMGSKTIFVI